MRICLQHIGVCSQMIRSLKGRIHCEIFLSEHFMKYSFRDISWTTKCFHEMLFFSISNVIACVSHQYKNCLYREKMSIALILINDIFCSKQKQKNQKDQNVSEWNQDWKTGMTKKHVLAYFQNFGWLTNSSIIFKWMLDHTIDHTMIFIYWLLFTFNNTVCIDYFDASTYTNFHNSLQYTFFILQISSSLLRN